ncbi:nuclear receptor corepressor 2-like isoform X3 [Ostrinia furnacalis]|uniref:nuclear receptor corepressor 2-like isoform X3 n=1 Tax=Ostrinia furnacalis TaxID=93504 RepID=UPI00103886F3|nr:nuclear receptor corepressor 2-like isoform X3 [Ostrinia furnacalis]XP_028166203.1 nuclear receptor corepressor 2-like isoform X3 [Ostrinia furnacalis]
MSNRAWVTLATNDSYGLGALVLAHSLRRATSAYPAVVLITPSVTDAMRERLRAVFADVVIVDVLDSKDAAHLALLQRPELGITFTKIHCWSLTQYEKCVFLDADTLVIQNCDELFEREELSAAPDVGWPDCFNSGVFVYKPSNETFEKLIKFAQERGSFDGGDQGLLNSFFSEWAHGDINKHLPFLYNVTSAAFYSYLPALKHYGQDLKIIHFIGIAKPWLQQFNWESRTVDASDHLKGLLQLWWDLFVGQVHSQLDVTMVEVQDPTPALPPHDVSQHYAPVVDPESEFPWHHPDAQPKEVYHREEFDLGQFHDPWEIYGGQIPPNKEEPTTHNTILGRVEDHEEMKKYAWEYQPSHQEYNPVHYSQESSSQHNYQPYQHHEHERQEIQTYHHHSEHHWESHSHDQSGHYHHHHQTDVQHWQQEPNHHHHHHQHEHQDHFHHENQNVHHHDENKQEYTDYGQTYHSHEHHHDHSVYNTDHQAHHHLPHQPQHEQSHTHHVHTQIQNISSDSKSHSHHRVEQVLRVHIDHDTIAKLHAPKGDQTEKVKEMMNGDVSESESDYYEEIRPRHPYDGFYLRHRVIIDARGRKICTHEIPPTPSPSPSPPPDCDPIECPPDLPNGESPQANDDEEQSGVAGNLARVIPGASGSQREALDELTRRQGWEAGNIDYMGADSFDNIWAKISQTLSQPRVSPPKQLPKEPSPPKQEAPAPAPVEVAQEAATVDAPAPEAAPAPVAAPETAVEAPAKEPAPEAVEAPVTSQAAAPVEAPAPADVPVTVEAAPKEAAEPVAAAEIPATVEAVAADAPAPVDSSDIPATVEAASAPGEAPKSTEAPPEVPVSVETPVASEVAKDEPQKTETPALPPTPPVTPKSAPEAQKEEVSVPAAEPASESAPQVESVETPKEEVPVPVSEPVSESAPKVESVESKKEAAPACDPASESAPKVETPKVEAAVSVESVPKVESQKDEISPASEGAPKVESVESPKEEAPAPVEAPQAPVAPATPVSSAPASPAKPPATPEKPLAPPSPTASTDSPPLANTPSKEEAPALPAAKSTEEAAQETRL